MEILESILVMYNLDKSYLCNFFLFQRNLLSGDLQLQEFLKCNLRFGDLFEFNKRLDFLNKVFMLYNLILNFLFIKEFLVFNSLSIFIGFRFLYNLKVREIKIVSLVWQ